MTVHSLTVCTKAIDYLNRVATPEHVVLQEIAQYNQNGRMGKMGIATEQVRCLTWLAKLIGAKHYLEVGVFSGYSSTAMALTLPENGSVTACDISVTFTNQAQQFWQKAQVRDKITLHLQPALITFQQLLAEGYADFYDMALIDADKLPTPNYVEGCLKLVRPGGIIAIDNIFLGGRVWQSPQINEAPSLAVMRAFNQQIAIDNRVHCLHMPLADGLTLLMKKTP